MEFREGKTILSLDGRALDIFYEGSTSSTRLHVEFMGVDAKPKRDGDLKITVGTRIGGNVMPGHTFVLDPARMPEFEAFIDACKAAKEAGPG